VPIISASTAVNSQHDLIWATHNQLLLLTCTHTKQGGWIGSPFL
jgi:hypothetical protein